jgi:hypothetical protein
MRTLRSSSFLFFFNNHTKPLLCADSALGKNNIHALVDLGKNGEGRFSPKSNVSESSNFVRCFCNIPTIIFSQTPFYFLQGVFFLIKQDSVFKNNYKCSL